MREGLTRSVGRRDHRLRLRRHRARGEGLLAALGTGGGLSGLGVRATVDDLDVVKTTTVTVVARVNSAHNALKANAALVNPNRLPEGSDKAWYVRTVSPAIKALTDDPRMLKLLPPAPSPSTKGGA